jgi:adenylate cyclase
VVAKWKGAAPGRAHGPFRRSDCVSSRRLAPGVPDRNQLYAEGVARRLRVLKITAWIAAIISLSFGILPFVSGAGPYRIGVINLITAVIFMVVPKLYRFGELVAPLTFIFFAYVSVSVVCWNVGTDSGLQFYFLVSACLAVLILGIEHILLASIVAGIGAGLAIALQYLVPNNTGLQPQWAINLGFVASAASACGMVVATVWYALREIERAEAAMELEYERSESLLANILPESIAARLKDPARNVIADKYDDASILFADIAGFTERASDTTPTDLVSFLDRLYTEFDRLVDKHGLEKVKTSGDSYMVVSGVPLPRADHVEALASLALDMADVVAGLKDPQGREVPLRMGLAAGPVVAGVVGARRFFYDVWGDAVNVASRMESTDPEGRIQLPQALYERLKDAFVLEERGDVEVKGKGVMHTWYLVGRREPARPEPPDSSRPAHWETVERVDGLTR